MAVSGLGIRRRGYEQGLTNRWPTHCESRYQRQKDVPPPSDRESSRSSLPQTLHLRPAHVIRLPLLALLERLTQLNGNVQRTKGHGRRTLIDLSRSPLACSSRLGAA